MSGVQYWAQEGTRYIYNHWWKTTVPFMNWYVLMRVVINGGNAAGSANLPGKGPGSVITAYSIYGDYKSGYDVGGLGVV